MRRLLVPAAVAAVVVLVAPAHAAPFSYADPVDMPANGGLDIVSVSYSTAGRGKGKAYVPSTLVVTLTTAAPPVQQPFIRYEVQAESPECGTVAFGYTAGTVYSTTFGPAMLFLGCGGADPVGGEGQILFPKFEVKGNSMTWTIALKQLPKEVRAGKVLTAFESTVDLVEPVFGVQSVEETGGPALLDTATSDASWKIG